MKKLFNFFGFVAILFVLYNSFSISAPSSTGLGISPIFPLDKFSDSYSMSWGADIQYQHPICDNFGLTGSLGYNTYKYKNQQPNFTYSYYDYDITIGGRLFLHEMGSRSSNGLNPYVAANAGVYFLTNTYSYNLGEISQTSSDHNTKFGAGLYIGAQYPLCLGFTLDGRLGYRRIFDKPDPFNVFMFMIGAEYWCY